MPIELSADKIAGGLFLAQQVQIGVAAGSRINHSGEIPRNVVRVAAAHEGKRKGKLQRNLRLPDNLARLPILTIDRHLPA